MTLADYEIREYFSSHSSWLWDWRDRGDVLTWADNSTIAFRQEIAAVLARLEPLGYPRFGAIVLLLGASREGWEDADKGRAALEDFLCEYPADYSDYKIIQRVIRGLQDVYELRDACSTLAAKAELAAIVFESAKFRQPPAVSKKYRTAFDDGLGVATTTARAKTSKDSLVCDLIDLDSGLGNVDRASLELRLKTGLDTPVEAAVVELPNGESVRDLIRQLEDDYELGGVARLAKLLLAAVQFPRPLNDPDQMPIGGVSDITNRGPLDRLVLSELAYDDMTLAVRIAMNESLYLRREPLAKPMARQRFVLLDTGLRTWGVPRVFATAVGLALAAQADGEITVRPFRADGDEIYVVDFATAVGLTDHLAQLDHRLHPADALPTFLEMVAASTIATDVVLITTEDVVSDRDFSQKLAAFNIPSLHIATVNREGAFRLVLRSRGGTKMLREAHFEIEDVLRPRAKPATPLINNRLSHDLPAILNLDRLPLRLSYPAKVENSWFVHGVGTLTVTNDGRLLLWSVKHRGAEQIATGLPKGRLHWCSSAPIDEKITLVIGTLSQQGLNTCQIYRSRVCELHRLQLQHDSPRFVTQQGSAILVIYKDYVEAFDASTGERLCGMENRRQQLTWGGVFRNECDSMGMSLWHKLAYRDGVIRFESLTVAVKAPSPFLAVIEPQNTDLGPVGISAQGSFYCMDRVTSFMIDEVSRLRPLQILAISRDGHRIAVRQGQTSSPEKKNIALVDIVNRRAELTNGIPQVEQPLFDNISSKPLRSRFRGLGLDTKRQLTLVTPKETCWPIELNRAHKKIVIPPVPIERLKVTKVLSFQDLDTMEELGRKLAVATWPDGSRATLDSSGMLHLQSSDRSIPECTIVIREGETAGWTSDGRFWGESYFIEDNPSTGAEEIYEDVIQPFIALLG